MIRALEGNLTGSSALIKGKSDSEPAVLILTPSDNAQAELEITEFESSWVPAIQISDFEVEAQEAEEEFTAFFAEFGTFNEDDGNLARQAAYLLWSNTTPAQGNYAFPAVMMSLHALTGVWSWDHCFVALALMRAHPQQAWEQWWLPFELQTEEGMLPDTFTESGREYAMTKPPVHGWALLHMLPHLKLSGEKLERSYNALKRWTSWWLSQRDDDGDGIPQYNHGCESGWDNDSICSNGLPCEAPDLSVYLILQYDALANLSFRLGKLVDAQHWRDQAEIFWQKLQAHSYRGGQWFALQSGDHTPALRGDCLRQFWPLLLGQRLSDQQRETLLEGLNQPNRFKTAHGFATEAISSPCYRADGYWLGPIWGPTTYQVVEMLRINGRAEEAEQTARAFCDLCLRNGFRENFNVQTGEGLCDRGFAWTAAVCLSFLQDFSRDTN